MLLVVKLHTFLRTNADRYGEHSYKFSFEKSVYEKSLQEKLRCYMQELKCFAKFIVI